MPLWQLVSVIIQIYEKKLAIQIIVNYSFASEESFGLSWQLPTPDDALPHPAGGRRRARPCLPAGVSVPRFACSPPPIRVAGQILPVCVTVPRPRWPLRRRTYSGAVKCGPVARRAFGSGAARGGVVLRFAPSVGAPIGQTETCDANSESPRAAARHRSPPVRLGLTHFSGPSAPAERHIGSRRLSDRSEAPAGRHSVVVLAGVAPLGLGGSSSGGYYRCAAPLGRDAVTFA